MTDFTQSFEKNSDEGATLLKQSRALRSKCFEKRQRCSALLQQSSALSQQSSALLESIKNQSCYKSNLVRLHKKMLSAIETNVQKSQILLLKIQEYMTLLAFNTADLNLKPVNQFESELEILVKNMDWILYRYQFLLKEDVLKLDGIDKKYIKSINRVLIEIEQMYKLIIEIRDRYDQDYQKLKKMRELIEKIYYKVLT